MKIDHVAVAFNNKEESDRFFIDLLGLKEVRSFLVPEDLMVKFFGIKKDQVIVRYACNGFDIEVFITDDNSKVKDRFTHSCLLIAERDNLINRALSMGYETIKVPREDRNDYYLFIKDSYGNLYEIKSP